MRADGGTAAVLHGRDPGEPECRTGSTRGSAACRSSFRTRTSSIPTTTRTACSTMCSPPIWDGTRLQMPPGFTWGGRVANAPPNMPFPGLPQRQPDLGHLDQPDEGRGPAHAQDGLLQHAQLQGAAARRLERHDHFANDTNNPLDSRSASPTRRSASSARTTRRRSTSRATSSTTTPRATSRTTGR